MLELAAGTGAVTRHLRGALPPDASLTATDLNAAMIDFARTAVPDETIVWQQADAQTGSPLANELIEHGADPEAFREELTKRLTAAGGERPFRAELAATVITATR